jgi:hypothetical protein
VVVVEETQTTIDGGTAGVAGMKTGSLACVEGGKGILACTHEEIPLLRLPGALARLLGRPSDAAADGQTGS